MNSTNRVGGMGDRTKSIAGEEHREENIATWADQSALLLGR
jgi:hypothetical protein